MRLSVRVDFDGDEYTTFSRGISREDAPAGRWLDADGDRLPAEMEQALDALELALTRDPYAPKDFGGVIGQAVKTSRRPRTIASDLAEDR
jgi:hypothetical protein